LERKNPAAPRRWRICHLALQWGRSGWSGRTRRTGVSHAARGRFNGAALVGAEERGVWMTTTGMGCCFNGAALVGAEERRGVGRVGRTEGSLQWGRSGWSGRTPTWPRACDPPPRPLQWGRSGWSGRTRGAAASAHTACTGFNGAALVGAEEPRCRRRPLVRAPRLQWGRSGWSGRTASSESRSGMVMRSFNGAALVGAEEPGQLRPSIVRHSCFNGAALVGAEERRKDMATLERDLGLQWGRSGWSGRTKCLSAQDTRANPLQWGRSGWSGRTRPALGETLSGTTTLQWGRSGWSGRTASARSNSREPSAGFNGAALVGAEERPSSGRSLTAAARLQWGRSGWSGRTTKDCECDCGDGTASMGPLWLERKNMTISRRWG